jgi:hypothetical protein
MLTLLLRGGRLSRTALFVSSWALLGVSAGLCYVGHLAHSTAPPDGSHATTGLPLFGLGAGVAWGGLFLLKRAVLPIRSDTDPPVINFD